MAFDVTEAYNYLVANGSVITIRPTSSTNYSKVGVHLHRDKQWTGHTATKRLLIKGYGQQELRRIAPAFVSQSGFNTVEDWLTRLVQMHGEYLTYQAWGLYEVELI